MKRKTKKEELKFVKLSFVAPKGRLATSLRTKIAKAVEGIEKEGITHCKTIRNNVIIEIKDYEVPKPATPAIYKDE